MAGSKQRTKADSSPAGKKRIVIIFVAGVAVLAALFLVSKVVMKPAAQKNPIAAVTSAPDKAKAVAAQASAASAKADASSGSTGTTVVSVGGTTKATKTPTGLSGPNPDTTRNPFVG